MLPLFTLPYTSPPIYRPSQSLHIHTWSLLSNPSTSIFPLHLHPYSPLLQVDHPYHSLYKLRPFLQPPYMPSLSISSPYIPRPLSIHTLPHIIHPNHSTCLLVSPLHFPPLPSPPLRFPSIQSLPFHTLICFPIQTNPVTSCLPSPSPLYSPRAPPTLSLLSPSYPLPIPFPFHYPPPSPLLPPLFKILSVTPQQKAKKINK